MKWFIVLAIFVTGLASAASGASLTGSAVRSAGAATQVWSDNQDGRAHILPGPAPDYAKSLSAEYSVGGTTRTLERGDVDGIPSTVWLTGDLGKGSHELRWRWVVDGVPQKWSSADRVTVSQKPLARTNVIDAFQDGRMKISLDGTYEVGQFADGEWYVVAPKGVTVTQTTPATKGSGSGLRNGASLDVEWRSHGLDGRAAGDGFKQSRVYDYDSKIAPGSMLVKAKSQPETNRSEAHSAISNLTTLTVLSERPPAGSLRPTVFASGGRELRNTAEIDLSRVPRVTYDSRTFPRLSNIKQWRETQLQRPAPPLANESTPSREIYPADQAASYHRTVRQDFAYASHLIMAENLTDETERMKIAIGLVQRMIDVMGAAASMETTVRPQDYDHSNYPYHWTAPMTFAGTLLRDPKMRGASALGLAAGDYIMDYYDHPKITHWSVHETLTSSVDGPVNYRRDLDRDSSKGWKGAEVWHELKAPRSYTYRPANLTRDQANLTAMGMRVTNNGNGTLTVVIPPNRYSTGSEFQVGGQGGYDLYLLDPRDQYKYLRRDDRNWPSRGDMPSKVHAYTPQHHPQIASMAPILKAIGGENYWRRSDFGSDIGNLDSAWELYAGFALDWMSMSQEWWAATGHETFGRVYPFGTSDFQRAGTNDRFFWDSAWIDNGYFERWDSLTPPWTPTVPEQSTRQMFTLTGSEGGFEFRLDDVPHDGWSRITDIEIQVNGGAWIPTGITHIGGIYTHDLAASAYLVAMRAVNAFGPGAASGTKAAPKGGGGTKPPSEGTGSGRVDSPTGGVGGGRVYSGRVQSGRVAAPTASGRIAPPSGALAVVPTRVAAEFVQGTAAVPIPAGLPLFLSALAGLGLLSSMCRTNSSS